MGPYLTDFLLFCDICDVIGTLCSPQFCNNNGICIETNVTDVHQCRLVISVFVLMYWVRYRNNIKSMKSVLFCDMYIIP